MSNDEPPLPLPEPELSEPLPEPELSDDEPPPLSEPELSDNEPLPDKLDTLDHRLDSLEDLRDAETDKGSTRRRHRQPQLCSLLL